MDFWHVPLVDIVHPNGFRASFQLESERLLVSGSYIMGRIRVESSSIDSETIYYLVLDSNIFPVSENRTVFPYDSYRLSFPFFLL